MKKLNVFKRVKDLRNPKPVTKQKIDAIELMGILGLVFVSV